jgi:4a-hydroxytetrahydrobiopterin dehydratase
MTVLLDAETVQRHLAELSGWSGSPAALRRTVKAPTFIAGIRLVDAVADVAEELDHHPDIDIRWRSVTFSLTTHALGGVTERDVGLARRIDKLATEHQAG